MHTILQITALKILAVDSELLISRNLFDTFVGGALAAISAKIAAKAPPTERSRYFRLRTKSHEFL